jgi:hypothetical protein
MLMIFSFGSPHLQQSPPDSSRAAGKSPSFRIAGNLMYRFYLGF